MWICNLMCQVLCHELTGGGQPYGSEIQVSLKGVNSITGVRLILDFKIWDHVYYPQSTLSYMYVLHCIYYVSGSSDILVSHLLNLGRTFLIIIITITATTTTIVVVVFRMLEFQNVYALYSYSKCLCAI
jgi:hypothetical protein